MLLNKGRHPYTNETIIPEEVVEHVAYGRSVSQGKPEYPELVGTYRKSYMSYLNFFNRAPKYTVLVNTGIHTKATISLNMADIILGIERKSRVFQTTIWVSSFFPMMKMDGICKKPLNSASRTKSLD